MKNIPSTSGSFGLLIIRLVIGFNFVVIAGWMKISGGVDFWRMLGKSMSNIGITFLPEFWGFMAALAEFGGGILIMLGLFTRPASAFMGFTMVMATISHLSKLDPWSKVFIPFEMLAVFLGLILLGAGKFSLDYLLFGKKDPS